MFITLVPNHAIVDKLNKVNNKKIKGQDFAIKLKVWVLILFVSFLNYPCYCIQYINDSSQFGLYLYLCIVGKP
jgi:hypothetical protein